MLSFIFTWKYSPDDCREVALSSFWMRDVHEFHLCPFTTDKQHISGYSLRLSLVLETEAKL